MWKLQKKHVAWKAWKQNSMYKSNFFCANGVKTRTTYINQLLIISDNVCCHVPGWDSPARGEPPGAHGWPSQPGGVSGTRGPASRGLPECPRAFPCAGAAIRTDYEGGTPWRVWPGWWRATPWLPTHGEATGGGQWCALLASMLELLCWQWYKIVEWQIRSKQITFKCTFAKHNFSS